MLHMTDMRAAVAQSVERRLGKAEVGGSIPLGSLDSLFWEFFLLSDADQGARVVPALSCLRERLVSPKHL